MEAPTTRLSYFERSALHWHREKGDLLEARALHWSQGNRYTILINDDADLENHNILALYCCDTKDPLFVKRYHEIVQILRNKWDDNNITLKIYWLKGLEDLAHWVEKGEGTKPEITVTKLDSNECGLA